jgi:large subunit ribosomal protein L10
MLRHEKQELVEGMGSRLKGSVIALCADYRGITVAQVSRLRRDLRQINAEVAVVKNSLIKRAVTSAFNESEAQKVDEFLGIMKGPTMLITSNDDPIGPTKVLAKYVKEIECLQLKGAFFEGDFLDDQKINILSQIPGREELLSSLLRTILAPATNLVRLINEPGSQLVRLIAAHEKTLTE